MSSGEGYFILHEVSIRLASNDDVSALRELARAAYQQYAAAEGSEPEPMKADYTTLVSLRNTWLVEHRDVIIGLLVLEPHTDYLLLDNIAVAESVRGKGVGRLLINWSETQALAKGLTEIRLYTDEAMTQNRHYYTKRGSIESHRAFESGHHRVYYSKLL